MSAEHGYGYEFSKKEGLHESQDFKNSTQEEMDNLTEIFNLGNPSAFSITVWKITDLKNRNKEYFQYIGDICFRDSSEKEIGLDSYEDMIFFIQEYSQTVSNYYNVLKIEEKL